MLDFFDFMVEGGGELLHSHRCPHCQEWFHEDEIEWVDQDKRIARCPACHEEVPL